MNEEKQPQMNEEQGAVDQTNLDAPEEMQSGDAAAAQEERSMGAILGSIIVVIILLVAAFYLWGNRPEAPMPVDEGLTAEEVLSEEDPLAETLSTQSDSDALDAIEEDLSVDMGDLTEELDQIDTELGL